MKSEYIILIPLLFEIVGLGIAVCVDPYIEKHHKKIMLFIVFLVLSLIIQNVSEYTLAKHIAMPYVRTIVAVYGYCVRPLIILMFFYILDYGKRHTVLWILTAINALIYLTALFTDKISFYIRSDNHFMRGPLSFTCPYVSIIMLVFLSYLTVKECVKTRKSESLILAFSVLIIVGSLVCDGIFEADIVCISYLTMAVVSSTVFYYIWLHMKFVREHEKALMAEQRIQIMMSQIQPHFLYNTLSTIQALCRTDPEKASVVTERFGTYLRKNLESLSQTELITVSKELEHTKIYSEIENVRFDNIRVEYDTPEMNFMIPALSIQPLVENAIRHGVRIRKNGIVKVSTVKVSNGYEITVEDNGMGFDTSKIETADNTHIGLRNVRERIEKMCGGTFKIESTENVGTKITLHIPNQKAK